MLNPVPRFISSGAPVLYECGHLIASAHFHLVHRMGEGSIAPPDDCILIVYYDLFDKQVHVALRQTGIPV